MFSVEEIANIDKGTLKTLMDRESGIFGVLTVETVEREFLDYAHGEGRYEEFRSWRQAWRGYVEARREELEEFAAEVAAMSAAPSGEKVIGHIATPMIPEVLTAEHQIALF